MRARPPLLLALAALGCAAPPRRPPPTPPRVAALPDAGARDGAAVAAPAATPDAAPAVAWPAHDETACGEGTRARPLGTATRPMTGDPLPARAVRNRACPEDEGATWWLGRRPHVPLALVDARGLRSAGDACCAPFARRGPRWRAVDAWGRVVGTATIAGGEGYDVSRCFELCVRTEGDAGVEIFASERGPWRPPPSAAWRPSDDERASFARFVATLDGTLLDPRDDAPAPPLDARTLFFRVPGARGEDAPGRLAVAGGRFLVVARLAADGRWVVAHLGLPLEEGSPPLPWRPLAVFDMDGDGVPEVVYHFDGGDGWADVVLRTTSRGRSWQVAAESVGGSTA